MLLVVNNTVYDSCITALSCEESRGLQPTGSDVAAAEQWDVNHTRRSSEGKKKHKRKHHKRTTKAGMH